MATGSDVNVGAAYNPDNTTQGYNLSFGDTNSPSLYNPGQVDPNTVNPYASQYAQDLGSLSKQFNQSATQNAMNPDYYNQMQDKQQASLNSSLNNQYARMGMAGSSNLAGAVSQADTNNALQWHNQQLNDQMHTAQTQAMLDNSAYKGVMGIQGQYGGYENQMMDDFMSLIGAKNQQAAGENQMWGEILGGLFSGGGMAAGGALGKG